MSSCQDDEVTDKQRSLDAVVDAFGRFESMLRGSIADRRNSILTLRIHVNGGRVLRKQIQSDEDMPVVGMAAAPE